MFSVPTTSGAAQTDLPDDPPNIVVFYIDNASPHDGSLWNDPTRTPNISAALTTLGAATPREGRKTRLLTSF